MAREIITLSNGKKVANFSSPHPFTFTDGSVIPAVSKEESERLKVTFIENEHQDESGDINLRFELSTDVKFEMRYWVAMYNVGYVDVVFCPLPMITAIKDSENELNNEWREYNNHYNDEPWSGDPYKPVTPELIGILISQRDEYSHSIKASPFRAVRMEDRIEKLVSIDKQCI
jgi:hypothetical protein